jgi:pimeloyl-ACP methyl ester carboxylesterase
MNGNTEMAAKPSIVLVHGFWGGAAHWTKVILQLSKLGYDSTSAVENPLTSLADDAERTRKMVAQQKGPVLLVGHSYGGAVITAAGNQPAVVGLVYIAAFAPDEGESLLDVGQPFPPPPGVLNAAPDSDGFVFINPLKFRESFCQDLSADEAMVMAVTQKAPVGSTFADKMTAPAWKTKPSWYQVSSEDRMIAPDNERRMAKRMNAKKIIELPASHASLASMPIEVAAFIDEAAKATSA